MSDKVKLSDETLYAIDAAMAKTYPGELASGVVAEIRDLISLVEDIVDSQHDADEWSGCPKVDYETVQKLETFLKERNK
jgi:hypothetical protein